MAINQIQQEQLNNFLGPVKGALGGLPVAEKNQDYFIVFQQAGGTGPEIIDQTACFITYLVDSNGNISKPSEDYDSLNNLIQNFEVGKRAVVRNDAATAENIAIAGKQTITAIGRQQPILYSQTGSSVSASVEELFFIAGVDSGTTDENVLDYRGSMVDSGYGVLNTTFTTITNYNAVNSEPTTGAATFSTANGTYTLDSSASLQTITFEISATFTNTNPSSENVTVVLRRDGFGIWNQTITLDPYSWPNYGFGDVNFIYVQGIGTMGGNPVYDIQVKATEDFVNLNSLNFSVTTQNPNPGNPSAPLVQLPFWEKNSSSDNFWITASGYLSANYGLNPLQNSDGIDFGFSPVNVPFLVQAGDRIRFGYNSANDYFIYDIITPQEDLEGRLKLKLNRSIPDSVYMSNFLLHRVDSNDPAYIILDVAKNNLVGNTQNFNGVILPEYPTKKLKDNLDTIIVSLKERGIITDNES